MLIPGFSNESRSLWRLAGPLILSSLVSMAISITDVIMMGWIGTLELAAGAAASDFYSIMFYFSAGIVAATAPLFAHAIGRDARAEVSDIFDQGFLVVLLLSLPGAIVLWHGSSLLGAIGVKPDIVATADEYLHMMAFTYIVMLGVILCHHVITAHDRTRVIFYVTILALPLNALGNYAFMFGNLGLPALGLAGAGLSSLLVTVFMLVAFLAYLVLSRDFRPYRLLQSVHRPDGVEILRILRVGVPIGFTNVAELGIFMFSTIMMGMIDASTLAAHAIALRTAGLMYAVPLGLSHAVTIRVGYGAGREDEAAIRLAATTAVLQAILVGIVYLALMSLFGEHIVDLFLDTAASEHMVVAMALSFLLVVALMQPFDCVHSVSSGVLRGVRDTRVPMWISMFSFWGLAFVLAILLTFVLGRGGIGIWIGLLAGVILGAVLTVFRLALFWRRGFVFNAKMGRNAPGN